MTRKKARTTTAPVPFDPEIGFVGECAADGQRTRVASIALDDGRLVILNLVGYETSLNAALGKVLQCNSIGFLPNSEVLKTLATDWKVTALTRHRDRPYWLWRGALRGTKEKQGMILPHELSLAWGQAHPPAIPATPNPDPANTDAEAAQADAPTKQADHAPPEPERVYSPRYLVAGLNETVPPYHRFFSHLRGLRVVLPPTVAWVEYLWARSLEANLLTPLPALGVRVWRLNGDPRRWNALSTEGIRTGTLTPTPPTDDDKRRLGLLA
jgi:hypothetical protein